MCGSGCASGHRSDWFRLSVFRPIVHGFRVMIVLASTFPEATAAWIEGVRFRKRQKAMGVGKRPGGSCPIVPGNNGGTGSIAVEVCKETIPTLIYC